jgi:hypothetical protein
MGDSDIVLEKLAGAWNTPKKIFVVWRNEVAISFVLRCGLNKRLLRIGAFIPRISKWCDRHHAESSRSHSRALESARGRA